MIKTSTTGGLRYSRTRPVTSCTRHLAGIESPAESQTLVPAEWPDTVAYQKKHARHRRSTLKLN